MPTVFPNPFRGALSLRPRLSLSTAILSYPDEWITSSGRIPPNPDKSIRLGKVFFVFAGSCGELLLSLHPKQVIVRGNIWSA